MDFDISDEQRMLRDSVEKLLADPELGHDVSEAQREARWRRYAELGLLAMAYPEADGGLGMGPVETMVVANRMGSANCPADFLASSIHAASLLRRTADHAEIAALMEGVSDGSTRLAVADTEAGARYQTNRVATLAAPSDSGWTLNGRKTLVAGGAQATHLLVTARTAGEPQDPEGISLFLVPTNQAGLERKISATIDGRLIADVSLSDVSLPNTALLGRRGLAGPLVEAAMAEAAVASIHDVLGAMEELLALTCDYLRTRRQFGVAIGSFQALQHQAVDMFVELEQAKSIGLYATLQVKRDGEVDVEAIGAAKLQVNRAARIIGEAAVQLHGGIGMTLESKAGRLFCRLAAFQSTFGDSNFWNDRLIATMPQLLRH